MIVEINLKNLKHKLIISLVVIALFYVIYSTIPANEYGKNGEILSDINKFDYLNLALERHFYLVLRVVYIQIVIDLNFFYMSNIFSLVYIYNVKIKKLLFKKNNIL